MYVIVDVGLPGILYVCVSDILRVFSDVFVCDIEVVDVFELVWDDVWVIVISKGVRVFKIDFDDVIVGPTVFVWNGLCVIVVVDVPVFVEELEPLIDGDDDCVFDARFEFVVETVYVDLDRPPEDKWIKYEDHKPVGRPPKADPLMPKNA